VQRWIGFVARLLVGGVLLYAGLLKIGDAASSVSAVRAYQLLPLGLTEPVGNLLPMLEIVVGSCLLLGLFTRYAGALSAVLQLAFIVGIVSVWSRGIAINCGCFGNGGPDPDAFSKYPWEIARDLGLLALSLFLVWRPRTPFAVDNRLFPEIVPSAEPEELTSVEAES
jgi:uncharacterized membrane protein YphA (DoxX/SURF4 family)